MVGSSDEEGFEDADDGTVKAAVGIAEAHDVDDGTEGIPEEAYGVFLKVCGVAAQCSFRI